MRFFVMFVTAVCVLFLIKLRWPKKKNFYETAYQLLSGDLFNDCHIVLFIQSYFFLQEPLKTLVNSKYQSKGSTYILHLLAVVECRLFNVFF